MLQPNMLATELLVRTVMCPLPAVSSAIWMQVNPVQKLEQLCMMLVLARAAKAPVAVLFATGGIADYVRSVLKAFQEQQYFAFGELVGITPGLTLQQVLLVTMLMLQFHPLKFKIPPIDTDPSLFCHSTR
jgi:hypothetical protein